MKTDSKSVVHEYQNHELLYKNTWVHLSFLLLDSIAFKYNFLNKNE